MALFGQNLKFAVRQLSRVPGFTVTVIATLALAIGANTAIFSVVNALMLKSLPYAYPDRLGTIFTRIQGSISGRAIDGEQWQLLRDNVPSLLSAVSSGLSTGVNLQAGEHVQYLHAARVSAHYFEVLGIQPGLGRGFTADEDQPNGPRAVILSYALWNSTFGGNPRLVGQSIHLKGEPYTVVGILPRGTITPLNADVYTALQATTGGEGGGTNFEPVVRLRDGATWQQADAELNRAWAAPAARITQESGAGTRVAFNTVPLQQGETASLRPKALALMCAAGFILLIACANLAGLTLVRMSRRLPEVATRLALGATRWQIQKQLWVENLLLAVAGGAAGIAVGFLALRGLLSLLPVGYLPISGVSLDATVLAFTLAVSLATSVLFGMLPALSAGRVNLRSSMSVHSSAAPERLRLRRAFISGEVALTVILLAASGLLIRTLIHLETLPPGFDATGVLTAKASLDDARYHDPAAFRKLLDESIAAMLRIPGVENAAVGLTLPYERTLNDTVTFHDGPFAGKHAGTDFVYVTPGYFDTLRIPLLAGRAFTTSDGPNTFPVAIVNRSFAQKFFPSQNPVGHALNKGLVIIGVVADVQLSSGLNPVAPLQSEQTIYVPAAQMLQPQYLALVHVWFQPSWIVRAAAPVSGLPEQMQRALAAADPGLPFSGFYGMNDLMARTLSMQRIEAALLSAMAGLALLMSGVGIFALVASLVAQRTREIGIRIALGSTIPRAMARIGASGLYASGAGLAAGLMLSLGALRILCSVLYGVAVYDVATLAAVALTLAVLTLLATTVPVLRVARIDPAKTLRDE